MADTAKAATAEKVGAECPEYTASQEAREIWCDVMEGTLQLRKKCTKYLPQFPAENDKAYKFRKDTATLFNVSEKTRNVMCGLVFQDEIKLGDDVDPTIQVLCENIDNAGQHLNVFARDIFEDQFAGWSVILVDAPNAQATSLEEEKQLQLRPYWVEYDAHQVINWSYRINPVSKTKELELIVLREVSSERVNRFESEQVTRYRVFSLVNNTVNWELYREKKKEGTNEKEYILEGGGPLPRLTQIPVGVVGELGNCPPLINIALVNVKHFQTESDLDSILHKSCTPLPWGRSMEVKEGETLVISSDKFTKLGENGELGWAEITGSGIESVRTRLEDLRNQMALMGLSLLADKTATVDLTATEALLNNIGETAELRVWATALKDAIELCLGHTAEYLGLSRDRGGSVTLGTAWSTQQGASMPSNSDLMTRLDAANKADGLIPLKERLMLIYPDKDEAEIADMMKRLAAETPVEDQQQTYGN